MARRHYRLTLADAFSAHDEALTYGGRDGVSSLHLIESALGRPYSGYHLNIPDDEPIDDLVVAVASGETLYDDLVIWFESRLVKGAAC